MATGDESSKSIRYGLDNPRLLSQLKTGLVWDGKCAEHGNRRAVEVAGCDTSITVEVKV
jgi:hypothetical protein